MSKAQELSLLVEKRRSIVWPPYKRIGDYHGGRYECEFVSPYTKSAKNLDADVMLLLQDWSSDGSLSRPFDADAAKLGHSEHGVRGTSTNSKLKALLGDHLGLTLADTYGTNLFPFIKPGGMSARIPPKDLERAATEFALPQLRIVQPKVAICFGKATFNAMRAACGLPAVKSIQEGVDAHFDHAGTRVWCQAHPAVQAQNTRNRGDKTRVGRDWAALAAFLGRAGLPRG